jgi:sugar phosphate isomerase/epimerase
MHNRLSINSACFQGAGWPELAKAWKALDCRRVSFVATLLDGDSSEAASVIGEGGYALETICHPFLLGHQLDADDAVIAAEQEKLMRTIDIAAAHGGRSVFIASGGRGAFSWEQAAERFSTVIAPCLAHADGAGIELLVENTPQVYADLSIGLSLRDTVILAELSGLGLCVDFFSCWMEAGLEQTIARAMPRCHLIQFADYVLGDRSLPARAVAGDGAIPLRRLFECTLNAGYRGTFELEQMGPRIDAEGHLPAARRAAEAASEMLQALRA